jgi:membrane-associated phospholipid phosphatase
MIDRHSPRGEDSPDRTIPPHNTLSRRSFLARISATAAATTGLTAGGLLDGTTAHGEEVGPENHRQRASRAYATRHKAALLQKRAKNPTHLSNGDEEIYSNRIGNYSKGLPHDVFGEVEGYAYDALLRAMRTARPEDFEAIPLSTRYAALRQRKLVNPQAALAFDLEGADSHALAIPPAPAFSSQEQAGEIVEHYWMALTRDVPFSEYGSHPLTLAAMEDLSRLSDFRGPKINGRVTPQTLFRDALPGTTVGPYLSQFLWMPVPFGANYVEQRMRTLAPGIDYLTNYTQWLSVQRGEPPAETLQYDPVRRYIRNGRDLSQWVHVDVLFQAYFHALLIMLAGADPGDFNSNGMGVPFDAGNPYRGSRNQEGFGTFGAPHIAALLCEVATRALKAAWYQKWSVHRRLRPEAFAGRVHNHLRGVRDYPLAIDELQRMRVIPELFSRYQGYLLPTAFPEGSPLHPSYAAGHATVAGACVTLLKAWFPESYVIENPVTVAPDGLSLVPYSGPPLTLGGELNKLASNIATGRNIAGVHWRSDARESLLLGEAIAISIHQDQRLTFNEDFDGFSLTKFDGTTVTI